MRSLAILDVRATLGLGEFASETLLTSLQQTGYYEIVGQSLLQKYSTEPVQLQDGTPNIEVALGAARQLGVDGLLVTSLRIKETSGKDYGTVVFRLGDPEILAAAKYELYDVRSGSLVDRNQVASETYHGELRKSSHGADSEARVLQQLVRGAAEQLSHELAPHESPVEVRLASAMWGAAATEIREGTQKAQQGDWPAAIVHWNNALAKDPENAAAQYNLGVAHEALYDFVRSMEHYEAALAKSEEPLYRDALERVRQSADHFRLARAQQAFPQGPAPPARYVNLPPGGGPAMLPSMPQQ
jgi:hypothetical protein